MNKNLQQMLAFAPFGCAYLQLITEKKSKTPDFIFLETNPEFEMITGLKGSQIINHKVTDVVAGKSVSTSFLLDLLSDDNSPLTGTYIEYFSPFRKRWYKTGLSQADEDHYFLCFLDIHEQIMIKESLQDMAQVAIRTTDSVVITDGDSNILWVNEAFERLTEYTLEEVKGRKPGTFLHGKDTNMDAFRQIMEAHRNNKAIRIEILNYTKSGRPYWKDLNLNPIANHEGVYDKFIVIEREITDRKLEQQSLQFALTKQKVLNELLEISTQVKQLDAFLDNAIDVILRMPFLNILPKIGIFTLADDKNLQLKAHRNLSAEIQKACAKVPFGRCMCGKAAQTGKVQFASNLNHQHEILYEGITQHGHYNIPIIAQNEVLGVLVVYLPEGHLRDQGEVEFLNAVSDILASKITNINIEESLAQNEKKYRNIFENVQDVFYQTDMSGVVTEISPSIKRYSGYEADEVIGNPISKFYYYPDDRQKLLELLMQKREVVDFEVRLRTKDSKVVYTSVNSHLLFNTDHQVIGIEGSLRDISERVKMDQVNKIQFKIATAVTTTGDLNELIEIIREELGRNMETSNFIVALYNEKTDTLSSPFFKDEFDVIEDWPAEKSLTGLVIHENQSLLLHQNDIEELENSEKIKRRGGRAACWLGVPLRSEGKPIGAFVVQSYHDTNAYSEGDMELLEFISNQISVAIRRKKDEDEIALLSKSISQSPVSVVITDISGKIEYVNPKFTEITGYQFDEAIGQKPNILKSGKQSVDLYHDLWQTIKSGNQWTGELYNKKKNGELFWEFVSISPILDNTGKMNHFVAVKEDITDRKRSDDQMRDLASRLTTLIANLPSGILLETPQRKIRQTNIEFCKLFGIPAPPEVLVGYDCKAASDQAKDLFVDPAYFQLRIDEILAGKKPVLNEELNLLDGRTFLRDYVPILTTEEEYENLWHYRDITHQKKVEQDLKKQTDLQKILMDISSNYINMPLAQIEEEIMVSLNELAHFVDADRAYVFNYNWEQKFCQNTHEWCNEGISSYKDDLQNLSLDHMKHWTSDHKLGLPIIVADVQIWQGNNHLRKLLKSHKVKSLISIPLMSDSKCVGFVGFDSVRNCHAYSRSEEILLTVFSEMLVNVRQRATLEKSLIEEKKKSDTANKAKSEFLANMSHEIRTPLNGVIGFTDLLLKTPLNKTQIQYAENINISGLSLLGIINDILDFSKIEAGKMELDLLKSDIIELAEQASDIIKYHASQKGLELLLNIQQDMPRFAVVDPVRIKQILVNLLGNAVKFTDYGEVELKLTFSEIDENKGSFSFFSLFMFLHCKIM